MRLVLPLIFMFTFGQLQAQEEKPFLPQWPDSLRKGRAIALGSATFALSAGSIIGLNELWYAHEPRSSFHFFDDSREWNQLDKVGHSFTCYAVGYYYHDFMRSAGLSRELSIGLGGSMGSIFMLGIEVLDGFSAQWGFSWSDFAANSLGSGIFIGQQFLWGEQRIKAKFSWHDSGLSKYRPDLLGDNFGQRLLKDYNGSTYWLSVNIHSFIKNPPRLFPRWLNVAVGYGADDMLGAFENPSFDSKGNALPQLTRYRQFYFSLDVDLTRIRTRKRWLRTIFQAVSLIKFPFPTLEVNTKGEVLFHGIYF